MGKAQLGCQPNPPNVPRKPAMPRAQRVTAGQGEGRVLVVGKGNVRTVVRAATWVWQLFNRYNGILPEPNQNVTTKGEPTYKGAFMACRHRQWWGVARGRTGNNQRYKRIGTSKMR